MNAVVWLLIGVVAGLVNVYLISQTVAKLRPDARYRAMSVTFGGVLVRFGISAAVLSLALRQNAVSGVCAFVGLWVARWITIYLVNTNRLTWGWSR